MSTSADRAVILDRAHDLAFRARALAQAHALSEPALAYRSWRVARDEPQHPVAELTTWAATAFLTGYCVRRVEESQATSADVRAVHPPTTRPPGNEAWEQRAAAVADAITTDRTATIADHPVVLAALDDVIGKEVAKRSEHVREHLSDPDWAAFERFIAWWVLHGYAIRSAEG